MEGLGFSSAEVTHSELLMCPLPVSQGIFHGLVLQKCERKSLSIFGAGLLGFHIPFIGLCHRFSTCMLGSHASPKHDTGLICAPAIHAVVSLRAALTGVVCLESSIAGAVNVWDDGRQSTFCHQSCDVCMARWSTSARH